MTMQEEVAQVLAPYEGQEGATVPVLQKVQEHFGYLPPDVFPQVADFLDKSVNDIFGIATFYAQFRFTRPGRHTIKVCLGTACHVRGGQRIFERVMDETGIHEAGGVTEDYRFGLERVACIGCCALAPVVVIDEDVHSKMDPVGTVKVLDRYE